MTKNLLKIARYDSWDFKHNSRAKSKRGENILSTHRSSKGRRKRKKAWTSISHIQRWVNQLLSARREDNTGQRIYYYIAIKTKLLSLCNDSKACPPGFGFPMHTNAWFGCMRTQKQTENISTDSTATTFVCDTAWGWQCYQNHEPHSNAWWDTGMHNMVFNIAMWGNCSFLPNWFRDVYMTCLSSFRAGQDSVFC